MDLDDSSGKGSVVAADSPLHLGAFEGFAFAHGMRLLLGLLADFADLFQ